MSPEPLDRAKGMEREQTECAALVYLIALNVLCDPPDVVATS
jgi:hypothetical protein